MRLKSCHISVTMQMWLDRRGQQGASLCSPLLNRQPSEERRTRNTHYYVLRNANDLKGTPDDLTGTHL